jgi:hypothetical protein
MVSQPTSTADQVVLSGGVRGHVATFPPVKALDSVFPHEAFDTFVIDGDAESEADFSGDPG